MAEGFLLDYNGDLRDPFVEPQGGPVFTQLVRAPRDSSAIAARARFSSGVKAGTSGFLSRADMDLRAPLGSPQRSQASSRVEPCKSALLLSWKSSVRLPVGLTIGIGGFLWRCHMAVTPALMF